MECNEQDGEDSSLAEWRAVNQGIDAFQHPIPTVAHTVYRNTYAYCYPKNITIGGRTRPCPPNVSFLDSMIPWNTSDYRFVPKKKTFNMSTVNNVHSIQYMSFPHYFDTNEAFEKIRKMAFKSYK